MIEFPADCFYTFLDFSIDSPLSSSIIGEKSNYILFRQNDHIPLAYNGKEACLSYPEDTLTQHPFGN